jgi:peptidoglycan hydrolase-like protein with peptidoglycan-binding domain
MSARSGGGSITPTNQSTSTSPQLLTPASFTRSLKLGMTGPDVKALQVFLNNRNFKVAISGPGSPNNETTYFGPATRTALIKFQSANGITPAVGYFGPITMKKANTLLSN